MTEYSLMMIIKMTRRMTYEGNTNCNQVFQYMSIPSRKQMSNPISRLNQDAKVDGILFDSPVPLVAPNTLAQKMIPLRVPIATVILRVINTTTNITPANKAATRITENVLYHDLEQSKHLEVPRDRLSPS